MLPGREKIFRSRWGRPKLPHLHPHPRPAPTPALRLHGLDRDARYHVTDGTDPDGPHSLFSGAALMARGIGPDLPAGPFSSRMPTFTREPRRP